MRTFWETRDPRVKVWLALAGSAGLLLAPPGRAGILLVPAVALAWGALEAGARLRLARAAVLMVALTVCANGWLVPGTRLGPELLGRLRPSTEGLTAGVVQGARIAGLAAWSAWAVATGRALTLAESLEWGVRRSPAARAAVHRLVFPVVLALRIVPILGEEAARLRAVARLRGDSRGLRGTVALLPAWMLSVIDRADDLSRALRLRGYRPDRLGAFTRRYGWDGLDWVVAGSGVLAVVGGMV